jgi:glycosyltransferase involved in cell wall biosynthesis
LRLTAILPCHNHGQWIQQAIQSLLDQNHPMNIVVVDNGSIDGSAGKVRQLMKGEVQPEVQKEPWVSKGMIGPCETMLYSFKDGIGPSAARNVAIKSAWAVTDVFAFLDSDDCYLEGKIEKSLAVLQKYPEVGIVYSDYETDPHEKHVRVRQSKEPFSRERLLNNCIINMNSLIRREVFEKAGLFDEQMRVCEDYDFWVRATEHTLAYHIPEVLINWRVGNHSSTSTVGREVWENCYRRVFEKLQQRISG